MQILVDGDACPVKNIIVKLGADYHIPVTIICSHAHYTADQDQRADWVFVDSSYQNVDMAIVNQAKKDDIIVTQDYGLASLLLNKGCDVIHHNGFIYQNDNIEQLLFQRHLSAKIRQAGGRTKGPKPFNETDKKQFEQALVQIIEKKKHNSR